MGQRQRRDSVTALRVGLRLGCGPPLLRGPARLRGAAARLALRDHVLATIDGAGTQPLVEFDLALTGRVGTRDRASRLLVEAGRVLRQGVAGLLVFGLFLC